METWEKIDMEKWPRRDHFAYYTEKLKVQYNITAEIRVETLLSYCRNTGRRFYPVLIYLTAKTVNSIDNLKLFLNEAGELCQWKQVHPNYTIFHNDDKTFSDCWSLYNEDLDIFYDTITSDMEKYANVKGIKVRSDQPKNFFCVSCAPWTSFTGFNTTVVGGDLQYFPVITMGKYHRDDENTVRMPVNLNVIHAVCDGYHAGLFFDMLQNEIDAMVSF